MPPSRYITRTAAPRRWRPCPTTRTIRRTSSAQEIRLTSHDTGALHWVGGAFYSSCIRSGTRSAAARVCLYAAGRPCTTPTARTFTSWNPYWVKQTALFADGSYKFNDQWKLAAGVRWYDLQQRAGRVLLGRRCALQQPDRRSDLQSPTPRTRASTRASISRTSPTHDLNLYATFSKGFRPGGANQILPTAAAASTARPACCSSGPTRPGTTRSARRPSCCDNWLTINSDVYYIKWHGRAAGDHAALRLSVLQQRRRRPLLRAGTRDQRQADEELDAQLSGAYTDSKITSPTHPSRATFQVCNTPMQAATP